MTQLQFFGLHNKPPSPSYRRIPVTRQILSRRIQIIHWLHSSLLQLRRDALGAGEDAQEVGPCEASELEAGPAAGVELCDLEMQIHVSNMSEVTANQWVRRTSVGYFDTSSSPAGASTIPS